MNAGLIGMKRQICYAYGNNKTWIDKVDEMEDSQIAATYYSLRKSGRLLWQIKKKIK